MLCVNDIMTRELVTLAPETSIREAMETLSTNHLSGAPVVSGERVVGVISMTDILSLLVSAPQPSPVDREDSAVDAWQETETRPEDEEDVQAALSADIWDDWTQSSEGSSMMHRPKETSYSTSVLSKKR